MSSRSSKTEIPQAIRDNDRLVIVGRVRRPHGIGGEVVVESMTDAEGRFDQGSSLQMVLPADGDEQQVHRLEVKGSRPHSGALLVTFAGVGDRDQADDLRGAWLVVDRSEVPQPPEGGHYFFDLIGCTCHDQELGAIGEVIDVVADGGGFLLELRPVEQAAAGSRILIPFRDEMLVSVDTDKRRIETRLPEGLVEICTSTS